MTPPPASPAVPQSRNHINFTPSMIPAFSASVQSSHVVVCFALPVPTPIWLDESHPPHHTSITPHTYPHESRLSRTDTFNNITCTSTPRVSQQPSDSQLRRLRRLQTSIDYFAYHAPVTSVLLWRYHEFYWLVRYIKSSSVGQNYWQHCQCFPCFPEVQAITGTY